MRNHEGTVGDYRFCVYCGSPVLTEWSFCQKCGRPVASHQVHAISEHPESKAPIPATYTPPFKPRKRKRTVFLMDFVVIIAVIAVLYMAFTRENESGATTPSSPTVSLKPVTISNGRILTYPSYDRVCPLTVSVPSGTNNYYIYLKYIRESTRSIVARERTIHNGTTDDIAFYVEAGKSVNLNVPVGVYRLSYACGETWYGVKEYFGPNTLYYKSDDLLEFYADNQYYNGHTLELWLQSNGNFDRTRINESQFPA